MKRKIIPLLLAFVLIVAAPVCARFIDLDASITASAGSEVSDLEMLRELVDSIPERSTWSSTYIDPSKLSEYYDYAQAVLENPSGYDESYIKLVLRGLSDAYADLEFHTKGVNINKSALSLKVGASSKLSVELQPKKAADPVKWKSSDPKSVSVSENGTVKAEKYTGKTVTVTATSNGYKDTCKVTVTNPIASLSLSSDTKVTYKGMSFTLKPKPVGVDPNSPISFDVAYFWDSTNPAVCTVDEDGKVTAVGTGTATIICTAKAGASKTATCVVSVGNMIEITGFSPKFITVNGAITLIAGETESLSVGITPENATMRVLKWVSSDSKILKVISSGTSSSTSTAKVQALKVGTVKLTYKATDGSGKKGSVKVIIKPRISSLKLSSTKTIITPGKTKTLKTTISPSSAGNQVINWSSSDNSVASVDAAGKITAKARGTCIIYAKTTDGSKITASCNVRVAPAAASLKLSANAVVVGVGNHEVKLKPTVTTVEKTTYNDFVKFTSSDKSIAKVSSDGVVTGVKCGTAKITAKTLDGTDLSVSATVRVIQFVSGVECLERKDLEKNSSFTLKPTVLPSDATIKKVTFKSSNPEIATVTQDGLVRSFSKEGKCTITVTTVDGSFKAKCVVFVSTKTTGIKLSKTSKTIAAGKTFTLSATVSPSDATNKSVTWASSDKKVAKVKNGVVTAVAGGKCVITATASGGQTAKCKITVTQGISELKLGKTTLSLYKGEVYTLKKTVKPATSTVKKFVWKSTNEKIAVVSNKGVITAKGLGTCTIKCSAGGKTASCKVTVTKVIKLRGISLDLREISVASKQTKKLYPVYTPSNASIKTVKWSSSNKNIATVSSTGVVTGVKSGNCVVTCTSVDGGFKASCVVSVNIPVTGIRFVETSAVCNLGGTKQLKCTILPSNASDKTLVWKSSNPKIAKVSSSGKVTGLKPGKVTITAMTPDGKFKATLRLTVLVRVSGIKFDKKKITMEKGDSYGIVYRVTPSNATNKKVSWHSNNTAVATVKDGVITAIKTGNAIITATTKEGGYSATCAVKVIQPVSSVNLQYQSLTLNVGVAKTVTAYVRPITATNKKVVWSSSDKSVATVSTVGKVRAVGPGSCTIYCKSADGYAEATMKVTVTQPPKSIVLSAKTLDVPLNGTGKLKATVKPKSASNKSVIWSTNNNAVAKVDAYGVVTGVGLGSCTITARTYNSNLVASCKVTVFKPVTSIKLNVKTSTLYVGDQMALIPTIKPDDASSKTVIWKTNNKDVATVDKDGIVTAKSAGYVVITAKSQHGEVKATCKINVLQPAKGIRLSKDTLELDVYETATLKAHVTPKNASNPLVKWSSSNKSVVKVDSNGKLKALKLGKATITATSVDGGFKAKCVVKVIHKVHSINISKRKATVYVGDTFKLTASVSPENATNKKLVWSSSDQSVCLVSSSGKVTAVKAGTAKIIVQSVQGNVKTKCVVTVENPAKKITLSKTSATLSVGKTLTLTAEVNPANTTNKRVTWESSDKRIASVSSKGVVTAKKAGTVYITATTSNGISKRCKLTIVE